MATENETINVRPIRLRKADNVSDHFTEIFKLSFYLNRKAKIVQVMFATCN